MIKANWRKFTVSLVVLLVLAMTIKRSQAAIEDLDSVPDFNLLDLNGHNHQLQRAEGRAVVLFFTGTGCPIARKNSVKFRDLPNRFRSEAAFWIVNSYAGEKVEDMARECNELA